MDKEVKKLKGVFESLILSHEKSGVYFDLNFLEKREFRMTKDKVNTEVSSNLDSGVKLRAWTGESFLEYGQSSVDEKELEIHLEYLVSKAKEEFSKNPKARELVKSSLENGARKFKGFRSECSKFEVGKLSDSLEKLKLRMLGFGSDVVNVRLVFYNKFERHMFGSKDKLLFQEVPIFGIYLFVFLKTESGVKDTYVSLVDDSFVGLFKKVEAEFSKLEESVCSLRKSKQIVGGKFKVVLSPRLSGLLAHESFGHGMEADTIVRGRALAKSFLGKKIAKGFVNIVDYPKIAGKHGFFNFDFEGNMARKVYLVRSGKVCEPISDLYSGFKLGFEEFGGNGRFESFDHKGYVRMSNTYFLPGKESFSDLISRVEDGIFVESSQGGMEDPKGWGVQIQGCFGQRILNGKLVDEFFDGFTMTGFLPDIMKNISGVSSEFEIEGGGHCGKGHKEWVRVSEGGPYLLIEEVILG